MNKLNKRLMDKELLNEINKPDTPLLAIIGLYDIFGATFEFNDGKCTKVIVPEPR
jgi:hypothetical protein